MPNMNEQMEKAREQLKNSGMPPAQQEAMMKIMGSSSELLKAYDDVSAADKKAIKPYLKDIEGMENR